MPSPDYTIPANLARNINRDDGLCGACVNPVPASEWHHIHPRNLGGAQDSPQAHLCGSCHNLIHKSAFRYHRGEDVRDLTPQQSVLSKYIARCMLNSDATDETPRKVMLEVPDRLLKRLHVKKMDAGYTNLQRFLIDLLESVAGKP